MRFPIQPVKMTGSRMYIHVQPDVAGGGGGGAIQLNFVIFMNMTKMNKTFRHTCIFLFYKKPSGIKKN